MIENFFRYSLYLIFVLFIVLGLWGISSGELSESFDWVYVVLNIFTVIVGIRAFLAYGISSKVGKALFFLVLGFFGWAMGEALWIYYDLILGVDPFPSLADIFFVSSYPLFFVGLLIEKRGSQNSFFDLSKKKRIWGGIAVIILSLLVFVLNYIHIFHMESDSVGQVFHTIYSMGDLVLILVAFSIWIIVNNYQSGAFAKPWRRILAAFVFTLIADISFSFFEESYYEVANVTFVIDTLWITSYFLASLGFIGFYDVIKDVQKKVLK